MDGHAEVISKLYVAQAVKQSPGR